MPQIVGVGMAGSAEGTPFREASGGEFLQQIAFFDPAGNLLSNATFTLVEVPEPSAWSLLSIGLMFFLAMRIRRTRFRSRFHGCKLR